MSPLAAELVAFNDFGRDTIHFPLQDAAVSVPVYVNEFWTAKQRAAHSLHEISYRACFKPQLPRFFIERLTQPVGAVAGQTSIPSAASCCSHAYARPRSQT